jgi:predicted neuraminidase
MKRRIFGRSKSERNALSWHVRGALIVLLVSAAGFCSQIDDLADGKVRPSSIAGLRAAYLPIVFPSSHSSNLLALRNGDLLCAWYSGRWEGEDVAILLSRLPKGSTQWTKPVVAARKTGSALENPVLFEPPAGPLWLFYTAQVANEGQSVSQIYSVTSSDEGRTWGEANLLDARPGSFDRQRLVIADHQWLFPMYYTPKNKITGEDALTHYSVVQISGDEGHTWKECAIPESNGLVQPDVIELSPHRFIAFFRSRFADWVYRSSSEDGCLWTKPQATEIPNNNSSIQVARLRDGHLVMAFNNMQATTTRGRPRDAARWPMSVALSVDGGQTWPWVRDVDLGQDVPQEAVPNVMAGIDVSDEKEDFFGHLFDYSYPSIIESSDGSIEMSYTFRRRTIKCVTFRESWIKEGTTLGIFTGDRAQAK